MSRINVDYEFYADKYYSKSIPKEVFRRLSVKAEAFVAKITFGRIHNYELTGEDAESVKMAICAVADQFYMQEQTGTIASENNDGYSVNFQVKSSEEKNLEAYEAASLYLTKTTLMDRRVDYDYER